VNDVEIEEIYFLKAASLLHDPPDKAWIVNGQIKAPKDPKSRRAHEREAYWIASGDVNVPGILRGTVLESAIGLLMHEKVKFADRLASGIDRQLIGILVGEEAGRLPYREVKLKNIFDPKFEIFPISPPERNSVKEFMKSLRSILLGVKDPLLAWHVLYASYEALWIDNNLPVGPSDTRIPTHNVFDHSYSTAAISNWFLDSDAPNGILLMIDLAGVQNFISTSRKLRDLWASSYMVSALAWRLAWEFVEKLGPDVLLMPTCRHNSFYYCSLLSLLKEKGADNYVIDNLKKIAKKMAGYDPDDDIYPRFAIIPGTLTLILPHYKILSKILGKDVGDSTKLEKFIRDKYVEIWKSVYETFCQGSQRVESDLDKFIFEIAKQLEKYEKYGFSSTPPISMRIVIVDVEEIKNHKISRDIKCEDPFLYHCMLKEIQNRIVNEKIFRFAPFSKLKLSELTENIYARNFDGIGWPLISERGFDYCTSCGVLPAILVMPSKNKFEETIKTLGINDVDEISVFFSEGERLCPYCLIKRLMSIKPHKVLQKLLGKKTAKTFEVSFPSVSDVASIEFKENVIKTVEELINNNDRETLNTFLSEFKKVIGTTVRRSPLSPKSWWRVHKKLLNDANECIKRLKEMGFSEELTRPLEWFILIPSEKLYFRDKEAEKGWKEFLIATNKLKGIKKLEAPRIYYALIRADGDNMGKLISGKLKDATGIDLESYLQELFEGPAKKIIARVLSGKINEIETIIENEGIKHRKIGELSNVINCMRDEREIFTSMAFHVSLSRALMRAAIRDAEIIEERHKGVVVYAGGDDLLAITPISTELGAVYETRRTFSLGKYEQISDKNHVGFEKLGEKYFIPSLISLGRSYCVYEAHYMYPMYSVVSRSQKLLEDFAKKSKWILNQENTFEKDTLLLVYSPRGGIEETASVPLSYKPLHSINKMGFVIKEIENILDKIRDGTYSVSLIYDSYENLEVFNKIFRSSKNGKLPFDMLKNLFKRNLAVRENKKVETLISTQVERLVKIGKWQLKVEKHSFKKFSGRKGPYEPILPIELFRALRIVRNGLRSGL